MVLIIFLLLLAPLYAQTDTDVVLRSDTRLLQIEVTVRDSSGNSVENLQRSDFTLLDNGKPRPFTIFSVNRTGGNAAIEPKPEKPALLPENSRVGSPLPDNVFTNISQ